MRRDPLARSRDPRLGGKPPEHRQSGLVREERGERGVEEKRRKRREDKKEEQAMG